MIGTVEERFDAKVIYEPNTGCWLWAGATTSAGYGELYVAGSATRMRYAHRLSYERFVGPIPEGLQIDHLCRVRNCVNPQHLEAVPQIVNISRGEAGIATQRRSALITQCKRGHRFDERNTYRTSDGRRQCRACRAADARRYAQERIEEYGHEAIKLPRADR